MRSFSKILLLVRDVILNFFSDEPIVLISESVKWSIYEDCVNIRNNLKGIERVRIATTPIGLRNKVTHFASVNVFISKKGLQKVSKTNKVVLTWFHVVDGDVRLKYVPFLNEGVDVVHTSCVYTKEEMVSHGLRKDKIVVVPLGIDTRIFTPVGNKEKQDFKRRLAIPEDRIVIGSFQKDGNGWGEGDTPKLIKGPDIFCDVIERLAKKYPIHVLLTGPSRGYVKHRLEASAVPYSHFILSAADDVARYYHVLDLYLISSRAEGGPKALLEASASGIPVVTTNVGMVPDIMEDGKDCYVAPVEDVDALVAKAEKIIEDANNREYIRANAIETAKKYDIRNTVRQYYEKIYKNFLEK